MSAFFVFFSCSNELNDFSKLMKIHKNTPKILPFFKKLLNVIKNFWAQITCHNIKLSLLYLFELPGCYMGSID